MGEEITYCVRGCVEPCGCNECLVADRPVHAPRRREAALGLLCRGCANRLQRWLGEVPELYATLNVAERRQADDDGAGKGIAQKLSGSPALARLDVVTLQDPRTSATSQPDWTTGVMEPWDGSMYIPGEMATWAALLAEEQRIRGRFDTITEACGLLTRWIDAVCTSPWVDEFYGALRDVMRLLKTAHGDERRQPVGTCTNVYERGGKTIRCSATLYAASAGLAVRCRACGQRYDGRQIMLARLQAERDKQEAG